MSAPVVHLVDDDAAVRAALALLLRTVGMTVEEHADPAAFLARLPTLPPGCLVLDLRMPVMSGLQLQERLLAGGCDWPFILLTGHGGLEACRRAFKAGAVDFLTKPVDEEALIEAVQAGFARLDGARSRDAERVEARALLARLTAREREVLAMVGNGHATKEIARALDLSPRTVETHRANIAAKLGTASVAEMARVVLLARP
ncbi:response regulator [Neoroseomonas oryzicola]|uniref:Response regulator transcription factor n=1 Tax=Neoroseomonas oryzicola TaxID=535904 RepID=A0A9X9WKZ4_9PROT|nr:response regulator transcription factor [Neoroseomonas oryzicola]NKE19205.1 response regulator transcription factor [Neoroseomonas oryzicola]